MHWRRKWQPIQCSCLANPRDGGASWAAIYGVGQNRTRLKRLSSRSQVFLDFLFCIPVPYNEKDIFLVFSFERSCRSTSSIMGLMATACKRAYAIHNSAAFRAPVPMAVYCSTIHPPETLPVNSVSVSVSPWVLVCIRFICAL